MLVNTIHCKPISENKTRVSLICPFDGKEKEMIFNASMDDIMDGLERYKNENLLIQNAFPFLSSNEREFLLTGFLPEEFDSFFPDKDDDVPF